MKTARFMIAICDKEMDYACRLMEYLRNFSGVRYPVSVYSSAENLACMVRPEEKKKSEEDIAETSGSTYFGSTSRVEHKARMKEVARAIKEEFRRTNQYKKSDIIEADTELKDDLMKQEGIYKSFVEGRQEAALWKIAASA